MFPINKAHELRIVDTMRYNESRSMSNTQMRERRWIHLISVGTREFNSPHFISIQAFYILYMTGMGFIGRALKTATIDRVSVQKMQFFHWNGYFVHIVWKLNCPCVDVTPKSVKIFYLNGKQCFFSTHSWALQTVFNFYI